MLEPKVSILSKSDVEKQARTGAGSPRRTYHVLRAPFPTKTRIFVYRSQPTGFVLPKPQGEDHLHGRQGVFGEQDGGGVDVHFVNKLPREARTPCCGQVKSVASAPAEHWEFAKVCTSWWKVTLRPTSMRQKWDPYELSTAPCHGSLHHVEVQVRIRRIRDMLPALKADCLLIGVGKAPRPHQARRDSLFALAIQGPNGEPSTSRRGAQQFLDWSVGSSPSRHLGPQGHSEPRPERWSGESAAPQSRKR